MQTARLLNYREAQQHYLLVKCIGFHVRVFTEEIIFSFFYEDLEMSEKVLLDYLFLQQKSVSTLLYLDVRF